jgi:hypothetical protein
MESEGKNFHMIRTGGKRASLRERRANLLEIPPASLIILKMDSCGWRQELNQKVVWQSSNHTRRRANGQAAANQESI